MHWKIFFTYLFIGVIVFSFVYIMIKNILRKIRKRRRGPRATSSRVWRETYSQNLRRLLVKPSLEKEEIAEIYSLTFTEATEENFQDIINYINNRNFFKLNSIMNRLPMYQDELGETIGTDTYDILAIIDKEDNYYMAIIYHKYIGEYKAELKYIIKLMPFDINDFKTRRLVYPV